MITTQKKSRQQLRQIQRNEKKIDAQRETELIETVKQVRSLLNNVLSEDQLDKIALKTGFQKRKRELTPFATIAILMIGCTDASGNIAALEVMCLHLKKYFNISIAPQSLQERINKKEAKMFIQEIMNFVMKHEVNKIIYKLSKIKRKEALYYGLFTRILLQDSTVISLPETVARIFRGCGGAASKSAMKCDFIIDQQNHLIVRLRCIAGRRPDASFSGDIMNYAEEGDLVIRDLGYFNLAQFINMKKNKIKFISRLAKSVNVYLHKDDTCEINIIEHLEKLGVKNQNIDIEVYLGKNDRVPVRLVGVKVPPEVVEARRQKHKQSRGRSAEPSESLQEWNGYTMMVTNIPKEELCLKSILKIYKIRWRIELFFKNMKSHLHVDDLTGVNKYRILCLAYTKLALTWIVSLLYAWAQTRVRNDKEVSLFKFTRWLNVVVGWQTVFVTADFSELLSALEHDKRFLYKKSKKKQSTLRKKDIVNKTWKYKKAA